ncbi:uncharacterized protein LOC142505003 [Primulina tabacum]|uniref:uncharacterized protein LOC142505003 n=1 Tax=Primulina tabacum TaxID=48773 RepID=UPI003F5943E2
MEDGRWKTPIITQLFAQHLVADILAIPIPSVPNEDSRFWPSEPKGNYTVRDGYKSARGFYDSPASCSSLQLKSLWKFLWALSIPPKVRIFCWRVAHNIIPTERNLLNHHVSVLDMCPLCHSNGDSTCHALFSCPIIKPCWKGTRFWMALKQVCHLETIDVLLWMKEKLSRPMFEEFVMRTWATWHNRLRLIHKTMRRVEGLSADWSESLLIEFQQARRAISIDPLKSLCKSPNVWCAPPVDKFRLDIDAVFNENTHNYVIGGVVRNSQGQPILAFGRTIDKPQSVLCSELLAIAEGLKVAKSRNIQIYHASSDSLLAVQAVTSLEKNLSYVGSLAKDIRILLDSTNVTAHSLAAFAISSHSQFVWEPGEFPLWLINLVAKDILASQ